MKDFWRGLLATLTLAPGVVAFGLLYGMMARQAGFTHWEAWAMSLIVHAGSAQFTALGMWGNTNALPIILTTLIVNLRHLLMGASVAPYLRELSPLWKAILALWMADESYALAIAEYERGRGNHRYFLGANVGIYLAWGTSGLVGALLGTTIPDPTRYGLDLVFPLGFLGLLTTFLENRTGVTVALASGGLALLGALLLPGKWNIIVAGLLGSGLGLLLEEVKAAWKKS
ncbi:MAG: branched-chain amino acid ABC transporter permease [Chloroflexi bacterium]|nr:MAG: branched-chain amino acid ABC transporter permease [Chloroflexota bacterium]